jgi:RNA recognition motif-containing protein
MDVVFCVFCVCAGRSKGCAIVEYASLEDAHRAILELNDTTLMNRMIFVREDRVPGGGRGPEVNLFIAPAVKRFRTETLTGSVPRTMKRFKTQASSVPQDHVCLRACMLGNW